MPAETANLQVGYQPIAGRRGGQKSGPSKSPAVDCQQSSCLRCFPSSYAFDRSLASAGRFASSVCLRNTLLASSIYRCVTISSDAGTASDYATLPVRLSKPPNRYAEETIFSRRSVCGSRRIDRAPHLSDPRPQGHARSGLGPALPGTGRQRDLRDQPSRCCDA